MPDRPDLPTTQRAYTLRLRAVPATDDETNKEQRQIVADALWATHEAVNAGAKVFGDWLLTLRGGLDHTLAEQGAPVIDTQSVAGQKQIAEVVKELKKKKAKDDPDPIDEDAIAEIERRRREWIRNRRILLALSWLSVEDEHGAPTGNVRVATHSDLDQCVVTDGRGCAACRPKQARGGEKPVECRGHKLVQQLVKILVAAGRDLPALLIGNPDLDSDQQPGTWIGDCAPSLSAHIRDDAVWVNRSDVFDQLIAVGSTQKDADGAQAALPPDAECDDVDLLAKKKLTNARDDARRIVWHLLDKKDYLLFPSTSTDDPQADPDDEASPKATASGEGAGDRSRYCYGHIFEDTGGLTGKADEKLSARKAWENHLRKKINAIRSIATKQDARQRKPKNCVSPTNLHRQMFAKAASRLAQIWTKQRQQEADRQARKAADEVLAKMECNDEFSDALNALEKYCVDYRSESGATGEFRIRPGQITGWDRVVKKWTATINEPDDERAEEQRIQTVKDLQDADPEKKFGDANLFFRLADEAYRDVWWHAKTQRADHTILEKYVRGRKARSDAKRLKVAAYRHPNAYLSPIYCDFDEGTNLPEIAFRRLRPLSDPSIDDLRTIEMDLCHPEEPKWARVTPLHAVSLRFDREIGSVCDNLRMGGKQFPVVSRRGRIGNAAAEVKDADAHTKVGSVFDDKLKRSKNDDGANAKPDRFAEAKWSAKLTTDRRELRVIARLITKAEGEMDSVCRDEYRRQVLERTRRLRWSVTVALKLQQLGPWSKFIDESLDQTPFHRTIREDDDKNDKKKRGMTFVSRVGWPWDEVNKPLILKEKKKGKTTKLALVQDKPNSRGEHASLKLCRLPGLRLLSVDLGHRFVAACAVWRTLSKTEFDDECAKARKEWGEDSVAIHDLDAIIEKPEQKSNRATNKARRDGRVKKFHPTTFFRRIGEDNLKVVLKWNQVADNESLQQARAEFTRLKNRGYASFAVTAGGKKGDSIQSFDDRLPGIQMELAHPAPWAKLERQFLVKLQGEEQPAREASNREFWLVHQLEAEMKLAVPLIDRLVQSGWGKTDKQSARLQALRQLGWTELPTNAEARRHRRAPLQVDELMSSLVNHLRLALQRHADRARLAFGFTSNHKPMSGDRKLYFEMPLEPDGSNRTAAERMNEQTKYLQDLLCLWHGLAASGKWRDDEALNSWNDIILPLIQQSTCPAPEQESDPKKQDRYEATKTRWAKRWDEVLSKPLVRSEGNDDLREKRERKTDREDLHNMLKPVAELLRQNEALRRQLADQWTSCWKADDGNQALVPKVPEGRKGPAETKPTIPATGWHANFRRLTDWIMGWKLPGESSEKWRHNVGGLSVTRIATMKSLYQLHKAFAMRPTPNKLSGAPKKGETNEGVAQSILDAMERMREQRVKQLASRIVEAALGVGRMKPSKDVDRERPQTLVDESCHAVVIESLRNYRPDELQTRRENRQLMNWSAGQVRKYLDESCQLHGLHLREVMPNYTSRQDSRTGLPGIRCDDVPVEEFLTAPWWRKAVKSARKRIKDNGTDTLDQYLDELERDWRIKWESLPEPDRKKLKPLRLPRAGGDLFVAAPVIDSNGTIIRRGSGGVQADLNAAANIGLRALLDPDFAGKWWYLPALLAKDGWRVPDTDRCQGSVCLPVSWKVARVGDDYRKTDQKPVVADVATVKAAKVKLDVARAAWKTEQKKLPKQPKGAGKNAEKASEKHPLKLEVEAAVKAHREAANAASQREVINLWHDPAADCPSSNEFGLWMESKAYWNCVRNRVVKLLREMNQPPSISDSVNRMESETPF